MGCHTWFFRPAKQGEKPVDHCAYSDGYIDTEYADLFRTHYHDDVYLKSFNETIEFINKENISITDENLLRLKEFWDKYPDGVIEFG